jgi:ribosomal protein S18 acetylase RimI-like enzyme
VDTIGVDRAFRSRGFARAVLGQQIDNLSALHIERLETELAPTNTALLAFLCRFGFVPSQRLPLERAISEEPRAHSPHAQE